MERRRFIHLLGGGIVTAAATTSTVGCSAAFPDEAIEAWRGPGSNLAQDPRRQAIAYAVLAPNPHNRQPWLVDLREDNAITLYCDAKRLLEETDPFGRQILIGHGAFIELLVLALRQQKIETEIKLWPNGELGQNLAQWQTDATQKPVARIMLSGKNETLTADPLFAQVLKRHTPKVDYDVTQPVSLDTLKQLIAATSVATNVRTNGTIDKTQLAELRDICQASAKIEIDTPRTMMESIRLIRVGPSEILQHRDGISINTTMVRTLTAFGLFDRTAAPQEGSAGYKQALQRFVGHSQTAMGFVWMTTLGNSRTQQIETGRAYVRQHLKATELGVGLHPMSQALQEFAQMKPQYERVHQTLRGIEDSTSQPATVQMLCRLGYTKGDIAATPRRKLKDFET
ncbi:MAG: hypothetical protein RLY82_1426 [Pseudomonadota bacterium]